MENNADRAYGLSVKERREDRRWSQSDLARNAGLSREIVRRLEGGKHVRPTTRDRVEQALARGGLTVARIEVVEARLEQLEGAIEQLRAELGRPAPSAAAEVARKLAVVQRAAAYQFPAPPIETMLEEIDAGFTGEALDA